MHRNIIYCWLGKVSISIMRFCYLGVYGASRCITVHCGALRCISVGTFSSSELITKLSKQKLGKNCKRKTLPLPPRCWIRPCSNCKEFTKKCFKNSRFAHQTVCSSFGEKMCYVIKSILILIANFIFPRSRHYYIWFTLLQYLFI